MEAMTFVIASDRRQMLICLRFFYIFDLNVNILIRRRLS